MSKNEVNQVLIAAYDKDFTTKELEYPDFVSRREFINRTGIFVSPMNFDMVYDCFVESGVPVDEFIRDYEKKYAVCIMEVPLSGTFKYEVIDEDVNCLSVHEDIHDPNVWEIVNSLAMELYRKCLYADDIAAKYSQIVEKLQSELLSNQESNGIVS